MKERTKERLSVALLVVAVTSAGLVAGIAAAESQYGTPDDEQFHDDWDGDGTENYHYAGAQSNAYGDTQLFSANEDDPVQAHQVSTYSFTYDDGRSSFGTSYLPTSRDHVITVEVFSTPTDSGGATIRDPFGYDNAKDEALDDDVERAITLLHDFASDVTPFPLPDPFALAGIDPDQSDITIDRTSQKVTFTYNFHPSYQGADWLVRTSTPVKTGWYRMDVTDEASVGYLVCTTACSYAEEDTSFQFHAADFEVYR